MNNMTVQIFRLIAESIIQEIAESHTHNLSELCTKFIVNSIKRMALIYRLAIIFFTFYLNYTSLLKYKKTFIKLSSLDRLEIINKWRISRVTQKRQFMKLVLNLMLLAYYDSKDITDFMKIDRELYLRTLSFYSGASCD